MKTAADLPFAMPDGACDAHLHIIDPAFPNDGKAEARRGTLEEYRAVASALSLERAVFVQAKPFARDNACLLDAIARFGAGRARGVAVADSAVSDRELERLNAGGVRGLRFSVWNPQNAVVSFDDCLPLSRRVKDMGWNVQLHMNSVQLLERADEIRRLESRVVIDHMGRLDPALGVNDPAYRFIREMIDAGRTWVKLSGPYLNSAAGRPWDDASATAKALAAFAPERVLWGSDWPHVTEKAKPDDYELAALIGEWLPSGRARALALRDNPREVYGFPR